MGDVIKSLLYYTELVCYMKYGILYRVGLYRVCNSHKEWDNFIVCGGIIWALEYLMEFRSMIWRGGCHIE